MDPQAAADDDLVRSAQRGEPWALTAVWHRYSPGVLAYLRGRGLRDAEDLTSEVFLQVFGRIESFRGSAADLRTFVFSVAHARYVDEQRKRVRRGADVEFDAEAHALPLPSADVEALDALATERVRAVLEALAPDQRDVLLLRIVADLSLEQTAELLGKSIGAVKSLQHRGLAALRPVLGEAVSP
ncbi:MAG TPA: RNA polymerase sigma factor [Mycobacteriales bacterium]|nr:RNA polymerase sigma factor [Mycobacteriales bacterium]